MTSTEELRKKVESVLTRSRARSAVLTESVDDTDLTAQHSPLMSPLVVLSIFSPPAAPRISRMHWR